MGCNDTSVEYPRQAQVHELMLEQAAAHPAKTAVVCGTEVLSYEQLAERSGRLAGYLAVRGAGPGTRVGVYLERSVDLVVTLLAVLRTGAAYVPLDPVYPAERIEYALKDAATTLVVTQTSLARNVGADAIVLDTCCEAVAAEAPPRGSRRGELAYVIYISGSTGRPKGVQVGHVALTNFLCSMRNEPGFGSDDTMLAITPICFDVAALELFLPLIAGGTVHIAPAGTAGDGAGLSGLLRRVGPTHLQATPVTWKQLLAAGWTGDAGLTALCGGAALPRDLADELLARCGELWKMYGPAETTVWSTIWQVTRGDKSSIGTPIANTACHVLDPELRVLPAGFPGELYIGGDGVAAGYRHQPELTALKFTTQPYGVTLYRTGDLVTRDRDGKLCYLGRGPCRVAAS